MGERVKVLFITFIDFDSKAKSGSAVRPKRMYDAFLESDCDVMLISGITNNRRKRKAAVAKAERYLKEHRPDLCYIEPPTGPLFFLCDRNLIRKLHRMQIPIGFFYRDLYWKFKESDFLNIKPGFYDFLKGKLIHIMQHRDYLLLKSCVTRIYFPSADVNKYMRLENYGVLPPGCVNKSRVKVAHDKVNAIYVGGATERYGMGLLLESWKNIQIKDIKLNIVCQKEQWEDWIEKYPQYKEGLSNIEVHHLGDGRELDELYAKADFALIPILKTSYNDMAEPIKLYEYISNMLPVVATNCNTIKRMIERFEIGIVGKDNVPDFSDSIIQMIENIREGNRYALHLEKALQDNLWTKRVETIIKDLTS